MTRKRRPSTSPLQILARDFNWRMGNLRRQYFAMKCLDPDLAKEAEELIHQQMDREQFKYEAGVIAIKTGNPGGYMDEYLSKALWEAERNKRAEG